MSTRLPLQVHEGSTRHSRLRIASVAAVLALIVLAPYAFPTFRLSQITGALILVIAVASLNLLSGFGGQISLGHAAFFGLGAYTTGYLVTAHEINMFLTFGAGMAFCFIIGVLVSFPAMRVKGMYLALVTLAVGILFPSLVRRFSDITGGSSGMFGIRVEAPGMDYFAGRAGVTVWMYYVTVAAVVFTCFIVWSIVRSRVGRAAIALRDNETAAIISGVNRTFIRAVLFGVSSALAGLAGGLFAMDSGLLVPDSFTLLLTVHLLMAMILGGTSSFWGPFIGGFLIYFVPEFMGNLTEGPVSGVVFGALVIACVFVMPSGIAGWFKKMIAKVVTIVPASAPSGSGVLDRSLTGGGMSSDLGDAAEVSTPRHGCSGAEVTDQKGMRIDV